MWRIDVNTFIFIYYRNSGHSQNIKEKQNEPIETIVFST